ncbi:MAG TPA: 50S ribosomal protein L11 methyltransferase [Kofleriaceae bacterium]|nr:50S ribosomal protein L11 methyltransferase [Kofleriaceae bacterium]
MSPSVSVNWVEIVVPVGAADVDDVAALIASEVPAAAAGTEQRGDEVVFWTPEADAAAALAQTQDAVTRWRAGGLAVDPARVHVATALPEAEWRDAWKKYFRVSRLTRQFVVVPSWETFAPGPDDLAIALDPGMAFGTGTHASTRLVLEEIQALADRGAAPTRILDVGCGSGILAIATVKRWPGATCLALDIDPIAVDATRDNATENQVADRITAQVGSLGEPGPAGAAGLPYELVLANIQAHVLRELAPQLIASTARGGTLILSGLLTPQAQPLADELTATGELRCARVRASTDDPQWSCAVLVR